MVIVKLGGSLYNTPELKMWLNTLVENARYQPIVIVPGGGPFADQVRQAQKIHQFSDSYAHYMALLAMTQFGLLISGMVPECQPLHHPGDEPFTALAGLSVWLPDQKLLTNPVLNHSWDISSDSLALWLASELHAEQLILIKWAHTMPDTSTTKLCELGIIDRGFPQLYSQVPIPYQIMHAKKYDQFSQQLGSDESIARVRSQLI